MVNILPKLFFVASLYILSITPIFSRASYSRCSYCFLIDSSQCLLILWKQLSPSNMQWIHWQLIEFWRFVFIMKLYGFPRPNMSFCTISINHFQNHNFINKSTRYFQNFTYFENICTHVILFHEEINHSINCMYYRRLFGAKWKNSRVACSLKYEGLHLSIFATNHCW
jgi:hypothetical protein